jgi:hypothetical protein
VKPTKSLKNSEEVLFFTLIEIQIYIKMYCLCQPINKTEVYIVHVERTLNTDLRELQN